MNLAVGINKQVEGEILRYSQAANWKLAEVKLKIYHPVRVCT